MNKKNFQSNNNKNNFNIIVSSVQLKNPILNDFFFGYNIEKDKEKALLYDFKICEKYFCFFLSLKYHEAYPSYIEEKLKIFEQKKIIAQVNNNSNNIYKYLFCIFDSSADNPNNEPNKIINLKKN